MCYLFPVTYSFHCESRELQEKKYRESKMKCRSSPQLKILLLTSCSSANACTLQEKRKITQQCTRYECIPSVLTVNAIMCLLSLTHWARSDTLRSSSSGGSKYSLVSSSLRAVLAIVSEHDCAINWAAAGVGGEMLSRNYVSCCDDLCVYS